MGSNLDWRSRLYNAYISSGQTGMTGNRKEPFDFSSRAHFIESIIGKHIPDDKSIRILDLGCGYGAFLHFLKQAGYWNVFGVDVSGEQVAMAQSIGIAEIGRGDIGAFLATVKDSSVDVVLLIDVLEHFTRQELFDTLDEVFRVLKPLGKCIAHLPNAEGIYGMRVRYGDLTHELAFTPMTVHQVFSTVGFTKVDCLEDKPVVHGMKSFVRRLIWDVGTLVPKLVLAAETGQTSLTLSQNMLVVAVK